MLKGELGTLETFENLINVSSFIRILFNIMYTYLLYLHTRFKHEMEIMIRSTGKAIRSRVQPPSSV